MNILITCPTCLAVTSHPDHQVTHVAHPDGHDDIRATCPHCDLVTVRPVDQYLPAAQLVIRHAPNIRRSVAPIVDRPDLEPLTDAEVVELVNRWARS